MGEAGRRTATVLFTDLVGSTEQRSRLGDDAADGLRRAHDEAVGAAVGTHDGEVVKSTGDGLLATFGSAADALDAAVAAQEAISARNRGAAERIGVRAGLAIGDVAVEGGDVFGTPVVEASRLCDRAGEGQVLCSDFVRAMAGTRGGHEFEPVGDLELKGLPEPLRAHRVVWSEARAGLPFPPVLQRSQTFGFVGRTAELEGLATAAKRAATERTVGALVSGEPGAGKTRLVAQFAAGAHADGAVVLAGRCDDGLGVPFQPFVEALGHWVAHTPDDELHVGLGPGAVELTRLLPELPDLVPGLGDPARADPGTERYRLFEAIVAWLATLAAGAPVVLVLDDLHWASAPTLQLLRHVLRAESTDVLVVGTYRETDLDRSHPLADLLAELRRDEGTERIALGGLGPADVEEFVSVAAGQTLDDATTELAAAIHRETEGNPFFIESVLLHLVESGGVRREDDRWVVAVPVDELGIPEGVREVIGRRLARLSVDADAVLHHAALAGEDFDVMVLDAASDLDGDSLDRALDEAAQAGLIALDDPAPGRARFSHALVRATLDDEIPTHRRVRLHQRLAEAIETVHRGRLDHHLTALARHYAEAAVGGDADKAVDYLHRAAKAAYERLATEEAVGLADRAIDLLELLDPDPTVEMDLRLLRGATAQFLGMEDGTPLGHDDLCRVADLAERAGDSGRLAAAALAYGAPYATMRARGADPTRLDLIERSLASLERDSLERAELLAHLGNELVFTDQFERRRAAADEALDLARRLGDPDVLCSVLLRRGAARLLSSADALALSREAYALRDRTTTPIHQPWCRQHLANALLGAGEIEAAGAMLGEFVEIVGQAGTGGWQGASLAAQFARFAWLGDVERCRGLLGDYDALAPLAREEWRANYFGTLELERVAAEDLDRKPSLLVAAQYALYALDVGAAAVVDRSASFLLAVIGSDDPEPTDLVLKSGYLGELAARGGLEVDPAHLYERLLAYADDVSVGFWRIPYVLQRDLGWFASLAGEAATADQHFGRAIEFHATRHSPTNVAQDHRSWAWAAHLRGDAATARDHRRLAQEAAADLDWPRFDQQLEVLNIALD